MKSHYQKTLEFYQKRAKEKDGQYHPSKSPTAWAQDKVKKIALDFLKNEKMKKGDFILDAGCAYGKFSSLLAKKYPKSNIVGVDFQEKMLELAKQRNKDFENLKFQKANLLNLDLPSKKFAVTFCLDTLHHILPKDFKKVLKNLAMVTENILILEIKNKGIAKKISNFFGRLRSINIYETISKDLSSFLLKYDFKLEKEVPILGLKFLSPISILKFKREHTTNNYHE